MMFFQLKKNIFDWTEHVFSLTCRAGCTNQVDMLSIQKWAALKLERNDLDFERYVWDFDQNV